MKKIYQLHSTLNLVLWFSMTIIAFTVIGVVYAVATNNVSKLKFKVSGQEITAFDTSIILVLLITMVGYVFFLLSLYQLKRLVKLFVNKHFFTLESVRTIKKVGSFLMAATFLIYVPAGFYALFFAGDVNIKLGSISPESFFFLLIIALFFITLSSIFEQAKQIQDENEFTI